MYVKITHSGPRKYVQLVRTQTEKVNNILSGLIRPLVDGELSVVFYDMTSISVAGDTTLDDDIRAYGVSKDGGIRRQIMLGMVQTADGIPLYHEVFEGNTAEVSTFIPVIKNIVERFPVERIVVVADRGLLSLDNLDELQAITLTGGQPLEFILAVPGRRYKDFTEALDPFETTFANASNEIVFETQWKDLRLIVAHDPVRAKEQAATRRLRIQALETEAHALAEKLDQQDAGQSKRGRQLSDSGATAKFYRKVCDAKLSQIIKVDLHSALFSYHLDDERLKRAEQMDGKLMLVTNVADLEPRQIVQHYKALADIERGFRVMKSDLEIGPIYHRLPRRIRAHATICFIALVMTRILRQRLKASQSDFSPARALWKLRQIQTHQTTINHVPFNGISSLSAEQLELFQQLDINRPTSSNIQ
jgi:transposase